MFNFTNTTVINSNLDELSGLTKFVGSDDVFEVRRVGRFKKAHVTSFYKRVGYNGVLSTATFTPPTAPTGAGNEDFYRIELFMRLSGSQSSTMATAATAYKSKPTYIEFRVSNGDSASTVADNMIKAVRFYQQNMYPYITVSKDASNKVIISGADEYEVFNKANLQKLVSASVSVYPDDQNQYKDVSKAVIANGKEGFGTWMYITKNLRLPSIEATRFISPTLDERPVPNALYNQYTLEYCVEGRPLGTSAVGATATSITHNVFYVRQDLVAAFEAAVTSGGLSLTTITDGGIAAPTVAVKASQTVSKANSSGTALVFTADGSEKTTGGSWSLVGTPTGVTLTGNTIKAGSTAAEGNVTVKVTYQGIDAQGTVAVTA